MRIASSVTAHAVSEAWSFAIPVGRSSTSPAAWWVRSRAVVTAVATSASFSWIAWCWQIGFPKGEPRRGERRAASNAAPARPPAGGGGAPRGGGPPQVPGERAPAARQFLQDHGAGGEIEPQAAVLGRDEGAQAAELRQLLDDLPRVPTRRFEIVGNGDDLLFDELPHGEDHLLPLDGQALEGGQRAGLLAGTLDDVPRDDEALDLVGALADEHERRVTVVALEVEALERAGLAVDPHGGGGDLLSGLRRVELGHPGLEVAALPPVLHPGGPVGHEARGGQLRRHVGQHRRSLFGLRPGLDVLNRGVEGGLGHAHGARRDVDAAGLEPRPPLLEPAPLDPAPA